MGVSTDGILFYGFDLGEPGQSMADPDAEWESYDWEDYYLEKKGVVREENEDSDSWFARKDLVLETCGCSLGHHCCDEYIMLFVAARDFSASRGYPAPIAKSDLILPSDVDEKLKDFCEVMGIEFKQDQVGWYLASYWG